MMEEVGDIHTSTDPHVHDESEICDALEDAAQTYVTESMLRSDKDQLQMASSSLDSSIGIQTSTVLASSYLASSSSSLLLSSGPSALPPNISTVGAQLDISGLSLSTAPAAQSFVPATKPLSEFTSSGLSADQASVSQPVGYDYTAGSVGISASTGMTGPALPPPPTMGFVPSHGVVTANPVKHHHPVSSLATPPNTMHIFTPPSSTHGTAEMTSSSYEEALPSTYSYNQLTASLQTGYGQAVTMNLSYDQSSSAFASYPPTSKEPVSPQRSEGFFGWLPGSGLVHKVIEKTKSSVESVITTLDPGMKEVIYSGGNINIVVTSTKEVKVGAVRQAFQNAFGRATVVGMESQPNIAPQPVGYSSGVRGAEERIDNLRQSGRVDENQVVVSAENFIAELLPDRWYDVGCVMLKDPRHGIELTTFSQATPVPAECVCAAQDATPPDYPLRWSGLALTVGQLIQQREPHVDHADWHRHYTGLSRRDMLASATFALAGMYRGKLAALGYQF